MLKTIRTHNDEIVNYSNIVAIYPVAVETEGANPEDDIIVLFSISALTVIGETIQLAAYRTEAQQEEAFERVCIFLNDSNQFLPMPVYSEEEDK